MIRTAMVSLTIAAIALVGCRGPGHTPNPADADTIGLGREYLRADEWEAERLLPRLAARPPREIASALQRVLAEPPPLTSPTGMLPDSPIRVGDRTLRYALYVPTTYRAERPYPLIVCLHGAGFGGDAYLDRWQPRLGDAYILACPTVGGGAWWTPEAEALTLAVLADVQRAYAVDPAKVFLTGMSNGGTGTFLIGLNHSDRFAALVPMASALPRGLYPLLENARGVPFYLIHGSQDEVMPVSYSRDLAAYLETNGYTTVYREHDRTHPMAGGHFFPKDELPALVDWLGAQRRGPTPRTITLVKDRDHPGRSYWVRIDAITSGAASFWKSERDPGESRRLQDGAFARMEASIEGQTIRVRTRHVARYTLLLSPDLLSLDEPVHVITDGLSRDHGILKPDSTVLLRETRLRPDPSQLVEARIVIEVPTTPPVR